MTKLEGSLIIHYVYKGNRTEEQFDNIVENYKKKYFFFGKESTTEKVIPVTESAREGVEILTF